MTVAQKILYYWLKNIYNVRVEEISYPSKEEVAVQLNGTVRHFTLNMNLDIIEIEGKGERKIIAQHSRTGQEDGKFGNGFYHWNSLK